jgi:hypothetical protein
VHSSEHSICGGSLGLRSWRGRSGLALALLACACASGPAGPQIETGPGARVTENGLHRVRDTREGIAYLRPGADFRLYPGVLIETVTVEYKVPPTQGVQLDTGLQHFALSAKDLKKLQRYFRDAFVKEFESSKILVLVDEPGPGVLRAVPRLLDVVVRAPPNRERDSDLMFVSMTGEMTLSFEVRDSQSDEALGRYEDRRVIRASSATPSDLYESDPTSGWTAVQRNFAKWSRLLRTRMEGLHALSRPIGEE